MDPERGEGMKPDCDRCRCPYRLHNHLRGGCKGDGCRCLMYRPPDRRRILSARETERRLVNESVRELERARRARSIYSVSRTWKRCRGGVGSKSTRVRDGGGGR